MLGRVPLPTLMTPLAATQLVAAYDDVPVATSAGGFATFIAASETLFSPGGAGMHRTSSIFAGEPSITTRAVEEMLQETVPFEPEVGHPCDINFEDYFNGRARFPRLEALHRLLCGGKGPGEAIAIDNGPGTFLHLSAVLSTLGSLTLVKEPSLTAFCVHSTNSAYDFPEHCSRRIRYVAPDVASVNVPTPADVVYWTNPNPAMQPDGVTRSILESQNGWNWDLNIRDYLGRDVLLGGYLVIQADSTLFNSLEWDAQHWERIFRSAADEWNGPSVMTIPTTHQQFNRLSIYRRR